MNRFALIGVSMTAAALALGSMPRQARADDPAQTDEQTRGQRDQDDGEDKTIGGGKPPEQLPPPRSTNEPRPTPSGIEAPISGVVRQAGIGSPTAYARAGVLELGGAMSFTAASDFTNFTLAPSFGWFFTNNLQASAILNLSHISANGVDANYFSALLEPSLHIPLNDQLFVFGGLGAGLSWIEGPGAGFALAPRIGLNILVGRSGVLTPQASLQYSTSDAISTPQGTLLAVSASYGLGLGYTVMW